MSTTGKDLPSTTPATTDSAVSTSTWRSHRTRLIMVVVTTLMVCTSLTLLYSGAKNILDVVYVRCVADLGNEFYFSQSYPCVENGLAVALIICTLWVVSLGICLPYLLRRLNNWLQQHLDKDTVNYQGNLPRLLAGLVIMVLGWVFQIGVVHNYDYVVPFVRLALRMMHIFG
jgi:hypothetical protein